MRKDPDETYSLKEKLAVTAVLLLPVALAVVAPRNFGETWPLSPYCVGGRKNRLCPRIDPLGTFRVHQDMICTRDVIEAVSLGLASCSCVCPGYSHHAGQKGQYHQFLRRIAVWADNV